jgi:thiamine-phosphate pyrophosphorylase
VKKEILRIVDANFNRSREGLRVCEDIARFFLNSPVITRDLKSVRHSVSGIAKLHYARTGSISGARDAENDVGRRWKTPAEMKRAGVKDIFSANAERVKESLRVLEEFYKLIDRKKSPRFSLLRYRMYEIEKKAVRSIEAMRYN